MTINNPPAQNPPPMAFADYGKMLDGGEKRSVRVDQITVLEARLRTVSEEGLSELAESIKINGLLSPLVVDPSLMLVAGARRLLAVKRLGHETVDVIVRAFPSPDAKELAEIDENLMRMELSPLERSEHLARRKGIYERMYPQTAWGKAPKAGGPPGKDPPRGSFVDATAEALGVGRSTVAEEVRIGAMPQEVRDKVRGTSVAGAKKQLAKLSRQPEATQLQVAKVLESGQADNVDGALALAGLGEEPNAGDAKREPEAESDRFPAQAEEMVACRDAAAEALRLVSELFEVFAEHPKPETTPVVAVLCEVAEKLDECHAALLDRFVPESPCGCDGAGSDCTLCGGKGWLTKAEATRADTPRGGN